jgi:DNA-binding IclR family transcriptional regulator
VRIGIEALLVDRLTARGVVPARYRVGGRLPLDGTGVGLVLLAGAPFSFIQHYLHTAVDPQTLRGHIAAIRRDGFFLLAGAGPAGVVTAPVSDRSVVVAAVSVVGPTRHADLVDLVDLATAARLTAHSIQRAIGVEHLPPSGKPPPPLPAPA